MICNQKVTWGIALNQNFACDFIMTNCVSGIAVSWTYDAIK